jgi:endonuclease G
MESNMKYLVAAFFVAILSVSSYAATPCDAMTPFGKPVVKTQERVTYLCRQMYVLEHSPSRKTAYWSAEHLIGAQQNAAADRVNAFKADPNLPAKEASHPADYANSGYDQGHMAPVGDMHINADAMLESFYLSNMVPQAPMNNRDGWNHLEYWVRGAAMKYQDVYVITGPIYQCGAPTNPCQTIGKGKVAVPTHLYKIVYDAHQRRALTFVVPNSPFTEREIPKAISNIGAVQKATGITFFPGINVKIQESNQLWY